MAIFTVHVPSGVADPIRRADQTIVVRDGFSWPAFWFGPLALAYRRLWLAALAWLVIAAFILFAAHALALPPLSRLVLFGLLALLTGMEARGLRQEALSRRGYMFAGLFASPSRNAAETAFFHDDDLRPAPRGPIRAAPPMTSSEVIGSFPQPGGR